MFGPDEAMERAPLSDAICMREPPEDRDRVALVRRLLSSNPEVRILVLEGRDTLGPLPYLEAGAVAYVRSDEPSERLVESVRSVLEGITVLDAVTAGQVVRRLQELSRLCVDQGVDIARCSRLTDREREVAARLARHRSNGAIAVELGVAVGTVKSHVHNILKKLDVETRSLAGVYWRIYEQENGWPAVHAPDPPRPAAPEPLAREGPAREGLRRLART